MRRLFIAALLTLGGCAHMAREGDAPYCMWDYESRLVRCDFQSMAACRAALKDGMLCGRRRGGF